MYLKQVFSAGLALFMIGLVAPAAQAAPVVGPAGRADTEAADSLVEKVHGRYRYHYSPYYHGYYNEENCYDSCGYTYHWGYGYDRPYYHRRHYHYDHSLDRYPVPVPPYRNERWWFNGNTE